jgi:hypothetical protein
LRIEVTEQHFLPSFAVSLPFRSARRHELNRSATKGLAVPRAMKQQKAPHETANLGGVSFLVFRFNPFNLLILLS